MAVGIECPVCEAVFQVKQVGRNVGIRCPKCDRKYRFSKEILATQQPADKTTAAKVSSKRSEDSPAPEKVKTKKRSAGVKTSAKKKSAGQSKTPPAESTPGSRRSAKATSKSDVAINQLSSKVAQKHLSGEIEFEQKAPPKMSLIQARKNAKTRRQTFRAITTIVILSLTTAILGTILYRQIYSPPVAQAANKTDSSTENASINSDLFDPSLLPQQLAGLEDEPLVEFDDTEQDDEPDEYEQPIELPRVLADELPKREFEYFENEELRSVWKRIRPRLVSLDVRTDLGVVPSVGIIVDSRGWALTSNQLVSKWPDVSATASARDIDAYYDYVDAQKQTDDTSTSSTLLTDVSKGIASAQANRDQALIALNTRFVVALDKFEYASRNIIVPGMYLAQVAPPSPTNPYGTEEVKVHLRQEFEELETAARNKAKTLGIDDPSASWLVTTKKGSPAIGTPVVTRAGKLAATYVFSTKQFAYFLMADQTKQLIAQAGASGAENGKLKLVNAGIELLSEDHTMARPSQFMNLAGIACEGFKWIPEDADQYRQLQKFSRHFSLVTEFIRDHQDDPSESVSLSILSDQVKRWEQSLKPSIRDSNKVNPEKIKQLNMMALKKLMARKPSNANTYIPFVAEVYSTGLDASNQDSILLAIGEDQAIVKVAYANQRRPIRPGTQWLCFYKRPRWTDRVQVELPSGQAVPFFANGNISKVIGPIIKPSRE